MIIGGYNMKLKLGDKLKCIWITNDLAKITLGKADCLNFVT